MKPSTTVECYDVGGTQLRGALIDAGGISASAVERSARGNTRALLEQIKSMSRRLGGDRTNAISIGLPGPVSGTRLLGSLPLGLKETVDFSTGLEPMVRGRRLFVGNDLNFAVRAELARGNGRGHANFVLLTLSTGIGVGAVLDSEVVERRIEVGHTVLELDPERANLCQGHRGCWVAQASGAGIETALSREGRKVSAKEFFNAPDSALLARIRRYNAQGIGGLINAFDPEGILVMGSIGRERFDDVIPAPTELEPFAALRPIPPIEKTLLGDEIGLYGAYETALRRLSA